MPRKIDFQELKGDCVVCGEEITDLDRSKFEAKPDSMPYRKDYTPNICSRQKCREKFERQEQKEEKKARKDMLKDDTERQRKHREGSLGRQSKEIPDFHRRNSEKNRIMKKILEAVEQDNKDAFVGGVHEFVQHFRDFQYEYEEFSGILAKDFTGRVSERMADRHILRLPEELRKNGPLGDKIEFDIRQAIGSIDEIIRDEYNCELLKGLGLPKAKRVFLPSFFFHSTWFEEINI